MECNLKFKSLHPLFSLPKQATAGSAGFDMTACIDEPVLLAPGERGAISLGCAVEIPAGWEIQVRSRSGLALKKGIAVLNSPGTIDSDYRGECKAIIINLSHVEFTINPSDRICQFVISRVPVVNLELVEELSNSERGVGGFGSTGIK